MSTEDTAGSPRGGDSTTGGAHAGAAVGLEAGTRFKCEGCGNLTRFDVVVSERTARYWHVSVAGEGTVEDADVREQVVESVTCRWCGVADRITVEAAPVGSVRIDEDA